MVDDHVLESPNSGVSDTCVGKQLVCSVGQADRVSFNKQSQAETVRASELLAEAGIVGNLQLFDDQATTARQSLTAGDTLVDLMANDVLPKYGPMEMPDEAFAASTDDENKGRLGNALNVSWSSILKRMDYDGDHRISKEEFLKTMKSIAEIRLWRGLDHDHDGTVKPDEYKQLLMHMGMSEQDAKRNAEFFDTNGDGIITKDEFVSNFVKGMDDAFTNGELDKNHDGFLDETEFRDHAFSLSWRDLIEGSIPEPSTPDGDASNGP